VIKVLKERAKEEAARLETSYDASTLNAILPSLAIDAGKSGSIDTGFPIVTDQPPHSAVITDDGT
jgi:hypothetical protein